MMRTARIYDALRRTTAGDVARSRIADALTKELRCAVFVCDRVTGEAYHPGGPHPSDEVKETVRAASQGTLAAGARSILTPSGVEVLVGEVPTHDSAVLAVIREGGVALDGVLIQHAATVVALELSQTHLALEHTRRSGAELTAQLVDGRIDQRGGRRQLLSSGLDPAASMVVSAAPNVPGVPRSPPGWIATLSKTWAAFAEPARSSRTLRAQLAPLLAELARLTRWIDCRLVVVGHGAESSYVSDVIACVVVRLGVVLAASIK